MATKGRKRKAFPRTPSGKLSRSMAAMVERSERNKTENQPHRRALPEAMRTDQRAESVLGRLFLAKKITQAQCWAGEAWRSLMREFSLVMATPASTGSSLNAMIAKGMETPMEADHLAAVRPETPEEKWSRVMSRYDRAMTALDRCERSPSAIILKAHIRERLLETLDAVVLHDLHPDNLQIDKLRLMLTALADHWRMHPDEVEEGDGGYRRPITGARNERPTWGHSEKTVEFVRQPIAEHKQIT